MPSGNTQDALISLLQAQMEQQKDHHQKVYEYHKEQNETNRETAAALKDLAHQIERSNDRHELNDSRILDLENYVDYSKPIVQRSEWWQSGLSEFAKKMMLPAIILGLLAAAGFNMIPSDKPQQKQEQSK